MGGERYRGMNFDQEQFVKHHRRLVWAYFGVSLLLFVAGIVGINMLGSDFLPAEGWLGGLRSFLFVAPFPIGLVGLMLTLPFRYLLSLMAKEQSQGFDESGILLCTILRPAGYPFVMHYNQFDKRNWGGCVYLIAEIQHIEKSLTHIIIKGRIHKAKFDADDLYKDLNFGGIRIAAVQDWDKLETAERRFSMVRQVRIPRNFSNEQQITKLNVERYNRNAQTKRSVRQIPQKGVVNRRPWLVRNLVRIVVVAFFIILTIPMINGFVLPQMLNGAIKSGDVARVERLSAWPGNINRISGVNRYWLPPVSLASGPYANLEIVEALLQAGADVNPEDSFAMPPVNAACLYCNPLTTEIVSILLAHGADIDKAFLGGPPIARIGSGEPGDGSNSMQEYDVFVLLVQEGARVGEKEVYGNSMLYYYALNGNLPILRYLLECGGFDVNRADSFGRYALFSAIEGGYVDIVEYLLDSGADMSVTNYDGQTALEFAEREGQDEIVGLIQAQPFFAE